MKKRILSMLIAVMVCFSLCACKTDYKPEKVKNQKESVESEKDPQVEKKEETKKETDKLSSTDTDWKSYKVMVGDIEVTLPCSYEEIANATKASMKSSDEKSYLESNYYSTCNLYKGEDLALYIEVLNNSGEDLTYANCKVTRVSQTEYQVENGAEVVIFPGNLKAGMEITEETLKGMFGEPTNYNEYIDDGYESRTYTWSEDENWTTLNRLEVTVINGVIDQVDLDHRGF